MIPEKWRGKLEVLGAAMDEDGVGIYRILVGGLKNIEAALNIHGLPYSNNMGGMAHDVALPQSPFTVSTAH